MKLACAILMGSLGLLGQNALSVRDAHYRLQSEDKIEVQYRYTPEYNSAASIQPDGYVSLPLTGEVKLEGLTLEEASRLLRCTRETVSRLIRTGRLRAIQLGGRYRISRTALQAFIEGERK